ncbi:universal stress protein [Dyella ginsengisoli]|uniref:universal stress protein n=1 Tax=Dyella ginsengisoli TaxID=363848 RepID=UPI0003454FC1|nr:universal stress protein [Dyella ginsengisoli]
MNHLLVCIDDSSYTRSVVDHAAWAASRLGAGIELLHAIDRHPERPTTADLSGNLGVDTDQALLSELAGLDEQRGRLAMARGHQLLDAARADLQQRGVSGVRDCLRHGNLVDLLEDEQLTHDLLVLGKRGEAADFARLHLGGTLERVLRTATRPVLVASRAFRPIARVLLAFDGSASSRKAVDLVARSPLFAGLECHVVMAASEDRAATVHMDWAHALLDALEITHRTEIIPGNAEEVIGGYVERHGIDLLVLGAYGHSRIRELLLGSTTTALIRRCLVPALVVR